MLIIYRFRVFFTEAKIVFVLAFTYIGYY
jgi:hypothetical protein